jgi:SAM-dependent methyltransferase
MKLHLGCGAQTPEGWVNVDYFIGARLARIPVLGWLARKSGAFGLSWPPDVFLHDLRRPFPWRDASAQAIYASHLLEHLTREDGARFLRECHRVLAPNGILRIVVPDLRAMVDAYCKGSASSLDFLDGLGVRAEAPTDGRLKRLLAPWFRFPHRCMYDRESLLGCLREAGFEATTRAPFESRIDDLRAVESQARTSGAVIAEGSKPGAAAG